MNMEDNMSRKINKFTALIIVGLMLTSCSYAKREQLTRVEQETLACRSAADMALANAKEAKDIALAADARTRETEVVINRTYKKSMYK